jgi:hypothetical protein
VFIGEGLPQTRKKPPVVGAASLAITYRNSVRPRIFDVSRELLAGARLFFVGVEQIAVRVQ